MAWHPHSERAVTQGRRTRPTRPREIRSPTRATGGDFSNDPSNASTCPVSDEAINDPLAQGQLISVREAARLVGCKPSVLYEARRAQRLAVYELGERRVMVSRDDLAAWLASRRRPALHEQRLP
jgi:excisionase family DNA binding protein